MGGLDLVLEFGALWLYPTELKIASSSPNQRLITKTADDHFTWLATEPPLEGHSPWSTGLLQKMGQCSPAQMSEYAPWWPRLLSGF